MGLVLDGILKALKVTGIVHFATPEISLIPEEELAKLGIRRDADVEVAKLDDALRHILPLLVGNYDDTGSILLENVDALANFLMTDEAQRVLLQAYKGFIFSEHFHMLEVALAARRYRLLGKPEKSIWLIETVAKHTPDEKGTFRPGSDLKKINNLLATGYIEGAILQDLETKKVQYGREAPARFRTDFAGKLNYFPPAIFVNSVTGPREIQEGLNKRFLSRDRKLVVSVWAAGEQQVQLTERALQDWIEWSSEHPGFRYECQRAPDYESGWEFRVSRVSD